MRGIPIIVPDGSEAMIRARFGPDTLPDNFRLLRATVALRGVAQSVTTDSEASDGIDPLEGAPERATGIVIARLDGILVVNVGFPLQVVLPVEVDGESFPLESRVTVEFPDDLEVVEFARSDGQR